VTVFLALARRGVNGTVRGYGGPQSTTRQAAPTPGNPSRSEIAFTDQTGNRKTVTTDADGHYSVSR